MLRGHQSFLIIIAYAMLAPSLCFRTRNRMRRTRVRPQLPQSSFTKFRNAGTDFKKCRSFDDFPDLPLSLQGNDTIKDLFTKIQKIAANDTGIGSSNQCDTIGSHDNVAKCKVDDGLSVIMKGLSSETEFLETELFFNFIIWRLLQHEGDGAKDGVANIRAATPMFLCKSVEGMPDDLFDGSDQGIEWKTLVMEDLASTYPTYVEVPDKPELGPCADAEVWGPALERFNNILKNHGIEDVDHTIKDGYGGNLYCITDAKGKREMVLYDFGCAEWKKKE